VSEREKKFCVFQQLLLALLVVVVVLEVKTANPVNLKRISLYSVM